MTSAWLAQMSRLRRVAFDSNALIYLLDRRQPYARYVAQLISMVEDGQATGVISTVVEMELLVKPLRDRDSVARDRVEVFLRGRRNILIRPLDRFVARRAADVRARTHLAPLDAIIVATSLEERCDAIIGNDALIASRGVGIPYLCLDDYVC